jgi:hypothetical protein
MSGVMAAALPAIGAGQPSTKETTLPKATNFQLDGQAARADQLPIVVLFSLPGCPHCEALRRSFLLPLLKASPRQAVLRQIDLNAAMPLGGFDGAPTTHGDFAKRYGIKFAPVVMFFTPDGKAAAEPLTGTMLPDFYGAYLDEALATARSVVRAAATPHPPSPL